MWCLVTVVASCRRRRGLELDRSLTHITSRDGWVLLEVPKRGCTAARSDKGCACVLCEGKMPANTCISELAGGMAV